jgi:para-aminobenzoate synthetase/4-amino-4-deoxychorismate lyase
MVTILDNILLTADNVVLLETLKYDRKNNQTLLFRNPAYIIIADKLKDIANAFETAGRYLKKGYYIAGYLSYEAGFLFDDYLHRLTIEKSDTPLIWLGVYKEAERFRSRKDYQFLNEDDYAISDAGLDTSGEEYDEAILKIRNYIKSGDIYQVNYTCRYNFGFEGNPLDLYKSLRKRQLVSYAAFIKHRDISVISLSPELFFRLSDNRITAKPMKGTIRRGRTFKEDCELSASLKNSGKNRAENLMIVDLLRNDLGKICEIGSINVPELYEIEKYETLYQMTSTIEGIIKKETDLYSLFKSIFPSGSVTGAPKLRAMEIIHELEKSPRGIYTGAIGYIAPRGDAVFNVAIRTIVINKNKGKMGVGSGIVWDSDSKNEYEECILKTDFLSGKTVHHYADKDFKLIESILWANGKYRFFREHIKRLKDSARYFGFQFDREKIINKIFENSKYLNGKNRYKVRVLMNKNGDIEIDNVETVDKDKHGINYICISDRQTDSNSVFLYHKTTVRDLYDTEYKKAKEKGFYDVIFTNERGEITEGCITNIFIKKNNKLITPPVSCGLLNGIYRQSVIRRNKNAIEQIITVEDVLNADEIYLCNSVRGMAKVNLKNL